MITERGSTTLLLLGYYISVKKNVQATTIFKMLISPEFTPVFCWVRVAHLFLLLLLFLLCFLFVCFFLRCLIVCLHVLSSVL